MAAKAKLTERQKVFAAKYVEIRDVQKAAIAAGYSAKNARSVGSGVLRRPLVAAEVARLSKSVAKKNDLSIQDVLSRLLAEANLKNEDGGTQAGRLKALELYGKYLKMFTDRIELDGELKFQNMEDTDLDGAIEKMIAKATGTAAGDTQH